LTPDQVLHPASVSERAANAVAIHVMRFMWVS
jgi:hypothetical protein